MSATWLDPFDDRAAQAERELTAPEMRPCPVCGGSGEVHSLESPPDPQTRVDYECRYCDGQGYVPLAGEW